jgi:hypothetical protein
MGAASRRRTISNTKNSDDARHRERLRNAEASARLLVDAGPGTGKTEIAAFRMARLIQAGLSPGQLLVLSFSRSAVRNLTRRLTRVMAADDRILEELRHISVRTFDSWSFRMLRLLGHRAPTLLARAHDENIEALTGLIAGGQRDRVRTQIGDRRHLIVDEFQDLPGVRGELVLALLDLLAPSGRAGAGFTVLGDPAQAIYGFAAAAADRKFPTPTEYWNRIRETYSPDLEVLTLTRNYRADRPLATLSSSVRKVLLSERTDDEKLRFVRKAVAGLPLPDKPVGRSWLNSGESRSRAILTRTNGEALRVLQNLFGNEVEGGETPVRLRAGSHIALPPAWVAALLGPAKSAQIPKSQFGRIYGYVAQVWGEETCRRFGLPSETTTWSRLCRASGAPEDANSLQLPELRNRLGWPDAFPDDQISGEDGLVVTTIHQSKGLEFDVVTVLDSSPNDLEEDTNGDGRDRPPVLEEASVHYVAVTRAGHELNRLDSNELFRAPRKRQLRNDRERLCHWRGGWMNMEMGLKGDLDPFGFVDPGLHGGTGAVTELQEFLLQDAWSLQGHKVMLRKHNDNGKAVWHVHLQDGTRPARLIGRTASQLTFDLLDMLHGRGFRLPGTIMNLRIASVGTISSDAEFPLEEPYRTSRLWLGVSLFGTGDFKTYKRKR